MFFRIQNTFRKRFLGQRIKLPRKITPYGDVLYFPVRGLLKELPIQDFDAAMRTLVHSGFIHEYHIEKKLNNMGNQFASYSAQLEKTSSIPLEEGFVGMSPSPFGAKCYLLANGCNGNKFDEDFCIVEMSSIGKLDIAESFFMPKDT